MKLLLIVKVVLVIAAIVPLVLNVSGALAQNTKAEFGVLAAFVILYMAQFFINLDPKPELSDEEEDDVDEEDEEEEDFEEEDETEAEAEEVEVIEKNTESEE